jgi:6-phosphogluconolactonase
MGTEIKIVPDSAALNRVAAAEFQTAAESAIAEHDWFSVALSGGNTPRSFYSLLAQEYKTALPWNKIHFFFGDERYVPADHPDSNYRMANEALFSQISIPAENIHRVRTELSPESAASEYESELRSQFGLKSNDLPRLDLVLLGLGDDGHTASLFPGSAAVQETSCLVVANWVEKFQGFRITLTFPVLNHAAEVLFLVSGASKAQILREVLGSGTTEFPAQRVRPDHGRLLWLADKDAAKLLPR